MKHLFLFIAVTAFISQGCGNNPKPLQNKVIDQEKTSEAPATAMAETLTANEVINADSGNTDSTSVKLTREVFLKKVWDYNNSPQEWKYLGDKPALIDFYADWCGPCRIASPILEELAREFAGKIVVYKIDTDKERELASVFGIQGIPAFLYIPVKGKPMMTSGIARSQEDTKKMFIDNINKILLASN